jgi:hypothetical protein
MAAAAVRLSKSRSGSTGYVLGPDVFLIPLQDGTMGLLDLDGSYVCLSQTAAKMLKGISTRSEAETIEQIADEYDVEVATVRADLNQLIASLRTNGLIRRRGDRQLRARFRRVIAIVIGYPVLASLGFVSNPRLKSLALLALARIQFRLAGWARTVDTWRNYLRRYEVFDTAARQDSLLDSIESGVNGWANHLLSVSCKERALCSWFMLRAAGIPAVLVMGVQFSPFSGHCWCELDGRVLADSQESCGAYTRIICYEN